MKKIIIALIILLGIIAWYFTRSNPTSLAENRVRELPEVKNLLTSKGNWTVRGEERNGYIQVQVAEVVDGHTSTFNWYKVDKQENIICSMFTYDEKGNLQKDIEAKDCN